MKFQKLSPTLQDKLRQATLMLRFRTTQPIWKSYKYLTYKVIAKTLNLTYNEVQYICRKSFKAKKIISQKKKLYKLDQQHFDFLLNHKTLELWAGLTMKERTKLFHRNFPDKRVSVSSLRRLYIKNKMKRKKVRLEKIVTQTVQYDFS